MSSRRAIPAAILLAAGLGSIYLALRLRELPGANSSADSTSNSISNSITNSTTNSSAGREAPPRLPISGAPGAIPPAPIAAPTALDKPGPPPPPAPDKHSPLQLTPIDTGALDPSRDDPGPGADHIERYAGRSGRLSPSASPDGASVLTRIPSTGPAPTLLVWVPSIRIQAGAEVSLRASVLDDQGAPVAAEAAAAIARRGEQPGPERPLTAAPAGSDHQLELRFPAPAPPAGSLAPTAYEYAIRATGIFQGEPFTRLAAGAFFVHSSSKLDPAQVRVLRDGGDLALLLGVQLDRPGTFFAYAELWGGDRGARPIAFARDRFERLSPGPRTLSLRFGGRILRESNLDGPYVVRNLRLQQVDEFPPQESEPILELPPTQAWKASEFY
jgi:hypothetical protein